MVKKICEQCGEEFEAKRKDARFCGATCQKRAKRGTKQKQVCEICGTEFATKGKQRYCSDECSETARVLDQRHTDQKRKARTYDLDGDDEYDY